MKIPLSSAMLARAVTSPSLTGGEDEEAEEALAGGATPGHARGGVCPYSLSAVGTLKGYSKALEYEYRVKTAALDTLK
jgi:hypothetical protein